MSCPGPERLNAFVDREGGAQELAEVSAHLAACPGCRRSARALAAAKRAVAGLPSPAMPAELRAALGNLAARARREPAPEGWAPAWRAALRTPSFGVSFAAAALAACLLWLRGQELGPAQVEVPVDLLMAAHQQYALTLPLSAPEELMSAMPERLAAAGGEEGPGVY